MSEPSQTPPMFEPNAAPVEHQPAFNVPGIVIAICAVLVIVHVLVQFIGTETYLRVLSTFSFIPLAYHVPVDQLPVPLARWWSPFSYFFLHGDWVHLIANLVWFAAFGSAVARRFSTGRFIVFMALATLASAGAHFVFHPESAAPVIGASGAVSACMGAAARFGFAPNSGTIHRPALTLVQTFTNRSVMVFVVVWFAFNWIFGAGIVQLPGVEGQIAWEAHMGGFVFGLLLFPLFDAAARGSP